MCHWIEWFFVCFSAIGEESYYRLWVEKATANGKSANSSEKDANHICLMSTHFKLKILVWIHRTSNWNDYATSAGDLLLHADAMKFASQTTINMLPWSFHNWNWIHQKFTFQLRFPRSDRYCAKISAYFARTGRSTRRDPNIIWFNGYISHFHFRNMITNWR